MKKKSQIYNQIFIYILSIVLTSFILIFGYNAIKHFQDNADKVCVIKFKNDLSGAVETIISDYGSVKRKDLHLCANYKQACFVESFEQLSNRQNPSANIQNLDPIIKDSIASNTEKNVFLVDKTAKESFNIGKISVKVPPNNKDILCIQSKNNQISLRLEGKGNYVEVSEWSGETILAESASRGTAEGVSITALPTADLRNLRGQ